MDFTTFSPAVVLVTVVAIALAPFVAVMVTSFTKIVVVLSLLRNALGLQQVPPNVVINGLAIVLSAYVMSPVILDTHAAVSAYMAGQPPPAEIQAQIEQRAVARAERMAARRAQAPQGGEGAPAPAAGPTDAEPPPASPAAADALRAEAEAAARGAGAAPGQDAIDAGASTVDGAAPATATGFVRARQFANVDNGVDPPAGASDAATADGTDDGPIVITATGAPRPPTPTAGAPMDAARMLGIFEASKEPLRSFLIRHSNDQERAFFLKSAQRLLPVDRRDDLDVDDFIVVIPAFTVSELTTAFQIGFLIFLPFLIIDLVVANILLALGMMMLSPTTISLPFKLLLFVLVDGWAKLVHGLVLTYAGG
ncbi:EscR/YscR/HrcR family type III secretion system export apparatus protein [Luteimonas sp. MC1750]|uniref:EscR/YscR/HrcR family type III secretion system export apparatus protein n=1 Tax=Luteimonas sp. MC1750 TaxID=2799326 RepID=UPI00272E6E05|nr:EscR/YscR/HrcR family type III secretion system export apparatus protein [Luteimonas sp. MC1750]